jgi:hypothetical protein
MAKSKSISILGLAAEPSPARKSKGSRKSAANAPAGYEPPSPNEMLRDRAHAAHRDTVEGWIKGEKSERQVKQSKARLGKVLQSCGK